MGLDTSHDAWHGPYSSFNQFRTELASVAGFPPLELMEGFYYENGNFPNPFTLLEYAYPKGDELDMSAIRRIKKRLPIKWDLFLKHPLYVLLRHSDCDGYINYGECGKIAKELRKILTIIEKDDVENPVKPQRAMYNGFYKAVETFAIGCELACNNKEKLEFR